MPATPGTTGKPAHVEQGELSAGEPASQVTMCEPPVVPECSHLSDEDWKISMKRQLGPACEILHAL
eukprot:1468109-Prorocentrum_lima.AAC.1